MFKLQLKFSYQGEEVECENSKDCDTQFCSRELLMKVVLSFVGHQLAPIINRIFEVHELFILANVFSQGENQLRHVIRISEYADLLSAKALTELEINKETLVTAVMFHDVGKGKEIDDSVFDAEKIQKAKVPKKLQKYKLPNWVDYKIPLHLHLEKGLEIAASYDLGEDIMESIALHHHVKIQPEVLKIVGTDLKIAPTLLNDIINYQPEQYAAKGSKLAQVVAILDQICALERNFKTSVSVGLETGKIEDELVKDLVIGVALTEDPRFHILGLSIAGQETVILFDLRAFGTFVQLHSEYEVQSLKKTVLNIIKSAVRGQDYERDRDLVGLVGGDEFVVITRVTDEKVLGKMIDRVSRMVKAKTDFDFRVGYGTGDNIPANFHEARRAANLKKKHKFV